MDTPESSGAHDLIVAGSGPSGSAAALHAAKLGLRVALLSRAQAQGGLVCAGIANTAAIEAWQALGVDLAACGVPFSGVMLRSWDLIHEHDVDGAEFAGLLIDRARLRASLRFVAAERGVQIGSLSDIGRVMLGEREVAIASGPGQRFSGRALVIADGAGSPLARACQLAPARPPDGVRRVCAAWREQRRKAGAAIILGPGLRVALLAQGPERSSIELLTRDTRTPALQQLEQLLAAGASRGLLAPRDVELSESAALAGAALDLDTHVGKRCLLVGSAGGFAAALSGEGLYPAAASGRIAAETIARALAAPLVQDELAGFAAAWRGELAGYLAAPSTDLSLLMPMLFQNAQMARRTTRAILLGAAF